MSFLMSSLHKSFTVMVQNVKFNSKKLVWVWSKIIWMLPKEFGLQKDIGISKVHLFLKQYLHDLQFLQNRKKHCNFCLSEIQYDLKADLSIKLNDHIHLMNSLWDESLFSLVFSSTSSVPTNSTYDYSFLNNTQS